MLKWRKRWGREVSECVVPIKVRKTVVPGVVESQVARKDDCRVVEVMSAKYEAVVVAGVVG